MSIYKTNYHHRKSTKLELFYPRHATIVPICCRRSVFAMTLKFRATTLHANHFSEHPVLLKEIIDCYCHFSQN